MAAAGTGSTVAAGYAQFVAGINNIPQGNPSVWIATDDLFIVGNGQVSNTPSNAFVIKKNGNTRVHGSLTVDGTGDVRGNTLTLGSYGTGNTTSAFSIIYDDGSAGVGSAITLQASRPTAVWNWKRLVTSGTTVTPVTAMQLDASNRLILTGTALVDPPQLVLDPNGVNSPFSVLTQGFADERYIVNGGTSTTTLANTVVSGNLAVSGSSSFTLPDGTILSATNTLQGLLASGTASIITGTIPATQVSGLSSVATTGAYSSLTGLPTIPTNTNQLTNGAGYITASGTAAFAQNSGTSAVLTGSIPATQVTGLSAVATSGSYSSLTGLPTIPTDNNQLANGAGYITASGTTNGITLSGTTQAEGDLVITGGVIVTGTAVEVTSGTTTITKIVSSGSNHLVLIPEQGDLSMGIFTAGPVPQ